MKLGFVPVRVDFDLTFFAQEAVESVPVRVLRTVPTLFNFDAMKGHAVMEENGEGGPPDLAVLHARLNSHQNIKPRNGTANGGISV